MATKTCNEVSYNGGKFKLVVDYEYSDGSMLFSSKCDITNKMDSSKYFTLEWSTDGSNWISYTTASKHNSDYTHAQRTVNGNVLYVRLSPKGTTKYSSTGKLSQTLTLAPSKIEVAKVNDSCIDIKVTGLNNTSRPISKVTIQRSENLNSWSTVTEITSGIGPNTYEVEYSDTEVEAGSKYYYRASAYNASSGESSYITSEAVYTSADSGSISNVSTSQSGNTVTVTWTCALSVIQSGVVTKFLIMRSANEGTSTKVGEVEAVAGQTNYTYTETVGSGNTYTYSVVADGSGGQASGGTTGGSDITTAPTQPSHISVYRNTSDNVVITATGSSNNADDVVIERSIDGGSWSVITTEDYASTVTYTDTSATASDNIVYRAKYTNTDGSSNYVTSTAVLVKQKPNAPYLKSPFNGTPIDMAQNTVRLVWEHRPKDGSPQQEAHLQYSLDDGTTWTTINLTTATYYDLSVQSFSANDVITWRVQTKGSHADFSDYSSSYELTLLTRPTLVFTEPDNADVITELPVVMEWSYNDSCGTLSELKVEIVKANEVVKTFNVDVGSGQSGTYTYSLAGFLFENNTVYGLKAYALSSSGLTAEDSISITIQYAEVSIAGGLLPSVVTDEETGYVYVTCMRDITSGVSPVAIAEAYLYRVHDNETVLIGAVSEGMQVLDKYAPINVDYEYKLLYMTQLGAVAIVSVTVNNPSKYWFCYFGNEIAKAIWNPTGSVSLNRPQRTEVRYSGRRFPVSYDQDALEETYSFSTVLLDRLELNKFRKLMQSGGQGIWKSGDGDAYKANFTFSYSSDFKANQPMWNCTLDVTRIDGGE